MTTHEVRVNRSMSMRRYDLAVRDLTSCLPACPLRDCPASARRRSAPLPLQDYG
jgi:hypothetical protein